MTRGAPPLRLTLEVKFGWALGSPKKRSELFVSDVWEGRTEVPP
jgi:hypothetical protein